MRSTSHSGANQNASRTVSELFVLPSYPQVNPTSHGVSEGTRTPDIQDHNLAL
jgi:hypothetical protein